MLYDDVLAFFVVCQLLSIKGKCTVSTISLFCCFIIFTLIKKWPNKNHRVRFFFFLIFPNHLRSLKIKNMLSIKLLFSQENLLRLLIRPRDLIFFHEVPNLRV